MSKKRFIDTKFWDDPWIVDELEPLDRYLFLYLMTNNKTNLAGIYEISLRTISHETSLDKAQIQESLKKLESRVIYDNGWMILRKAISHQNYNNSKVKIAIVEILKSCPTELLKHVFMPNDFGNGDFQKKLKNESSMSHSSVIHAQSHLDLDSDLDLDLDSDFDRDLDLDSESDSSSAANAQRTDRRSPAKKSPKRDDVDSLFSYWHEKVGYAITSKVQQNRDACTQMLELYGVEQMKRMIDGAALATEDKFAPSISDFQDMQWKFDKLKLWGLKRLKDKSNSSGVTVVS